MNQHSSIKSASLLERAAEVYDFNALLGGRNAPVAEPVSAPETAMESEAEPIPAAKPAPQPASSPGRVVAIDRERLRAGPWILPDAPVSALAEEFRLIKRQLMNGVAGHAGIDSDKRRTILVTSAEPNDGKTFCALNLALSLAGEKDIEVLLVDGDFANPAALKTLGVAPGPGLVDALADPSLDPNRCVLRTDIRGLSLLPAGRAANNVPELLAADRMRQVLKVLTDANPRRVVLFDSPPALMASHASILAGHVGQVLLVVKADATTEASLRDTVSLLSACEHLGLMLNGTAFAAGGRKFGGYYGYGERQ